MKVEIKLITTNFKIDFGQMEVTALITGASGGVGRAAAFALSRAGIKVVLVGRNEDKLKAIQKDIILSGGSAEYVIVDFSAQNSVEELFVQLQSRDLTPQILINSLGGVFESRDWSDINIYRNVYRLNTEVAIELTNRAYPLMSKMGWGRIIHFGSLSTKTGMNSLPYVIAKSALMSFVKFAANRYATINSKVVMSAIAPGPISVPGKYLNKLESESPEKLLDWLLENKIPVMRLVKIEEVINLVVFLISESGDYMHGSILEIDGGAI
jgi:3-oxoacyl-[acyl-carrier protein] reductase